MDNRLTALLGGSWRGIFLLAGLLLVMSGCSALTQATDSEAEETTAQADTVRRPEPPRTIPRSAAPQAEEVTARGVDLDTVRAGRFDNGRMWTFENPPLDYLEEEYGFSPDEEWFEEARLGALRMPGCTASFSSPNGLVLTNHHCAREWVAQVSRSGEELLEDGFYARSLEAERPVEGLYMEQLVAIEDVTDEMDAAVEGAQTDAERAQARQEAMQQIQQRIVEEAGGEEAGINVEVVSLYNGGQYSAYTFRRYENVRLVMAPELELGYFGGDPDNFTYPRFTLDMALFRVYNEDGEPLQSDNYFAWEEDGSEEGDLVFVVGNPGSTSRLATVEQLTFRRDVQDPAILHLVSSRANALQAYADAHPEEAEELDIRNQVFSLKNAEKLYQGRVKALNDPVIMARRRDTERQFEEAIDEDPALQEEYGDLVERMADIQTSKKELAAEYRAFLGMNPNSPYASATLGRALLAYSYLQRQQQGASDEALSNLRSQLLGVGAQPDALDERLLALRFRDFQRYLGENSEVVQRILEGRSPAAAAADVVSSSVLADSASTARALESGALSMDDPALQVVDAYMPRYSEFQSTYAGLSSQQEDVAGRLGRARFAVYGTDVPPDATFSLRISDGQVRGYEYNGTRAAPYTAFYGLYDHYYSFGQNTPWDLPQRWLTPPEEFDRSTSLNLVSTNDIIGGNSGSPLINRNQELVGLIFDGNIQSLKSDYIYMPENVRAVSVDVRGMLEALDVMYDLDRLVLELTMGRLFETENEADQLTSQAP